MLRLNIRCNGIDNDDDHDAGVEKDFVVTLAVVPFFDSPITQSKKYTRENEGRGKRKKDGREGGGGRRKKTIKMTM